MGRADSPWGERGWEVWAKRKRGDDRDSPTLTADAVCPSPLREGLSHQIFTRWSGATYSLSPGWTSKAWYQPGMLRIVPSTRK